MYFAYKDFVRRKQIMIDYNKERFMSGLMNGGNNVPSLEDVFINEIALAITDSEAPVGGAGFTLTVGFH
jgi:hypothetical protein